MNQDEFLHRCHQMTGMENEDSLTPESLIGFSNAFVLTEMQLNRFSLTLPKKKISMIDLKSCISQREMTAVQMVERMLILSFVGHRQLAPF